MKAHPSACCGVTLTRIFLAGVLGLVVVWAVVVPAAPRKERSPIESPPAEGAAKPDGKELFAREWIPHDPRSPRGDGLGPVFNDTSCVACHNQGGAGGGGPASKNVHILTTVGSAQVQEARATTTQSANPPTRSVTTTTPSGTVPPQPATAQRTTRAQVTAVPTQSFVLHHFGTDAEFATWRAKMAQAAAVGMGPFAGPVPGGLIVSSVGQTPAPSLPPSTGGGPGSVGPDRVGTGEVVIAQADVVQSLRVSLNSISQRNATALFGAGKIDSIPERVLEAVAAKKYAEFPKVSGRVARDDKGRVGRFGWKAQKASLDDFVLTACAVELGLQVPGHDQPPLPHKPDYKAPGLDLDKAACDALIKYVGELLPPVELKAEHAKHAEFIASGKSLFATVGCATCHTPKLGDVEGIYSDLLLHDMGPALTDAGSSYGIFQPNPPPSAPPTSQEIVKSPGSKSPTVIATAQEWRTPPLWGVRDSGPYLHDGRATTLEQVIAFHGGQAEESTKKFNVLSLPEKQKLLAFLKSLVAPEQLAAR